MTTTKLDQKQRIEDVPDDELEHRWTSIMHSIIQGASSMTYWHEELTVIRKERQRRLELATRALNEMEAQQQPEGAQP